MQGTDVQKRAPVTRSRAQDSGTMILHSGVSGPRIIFSLLFPFIVSYFVTAGIGLMKSHYGWDTRSHAVQVKIATPEKARVPASYHPKRHPIERSGE